MHPKITSFLNPNVPKPVRKPKPKIEKIPLTDQDKENIRRLVAGEPPTKLVERWNKQGVSISNATKYYHPPGLRGRLELVRKIYFKGLCHVCHKFPLYTAKYRMSGITLIEYYCQEHLDKI